MPYDRPSKCEELFTTVQLSQPVERLVYFFFSPFLPLQSLIYENIKGKGKRNITTTLTT